MKSINYKLGCLLIGAFCTTSVLADEFVDRVVQANQAIQTPDGAHYDQLLMPHIAPVLNACVAKIKEQGAYEGRFTLVADVLESGQLSRTQVQPKTPISECFAQQFGLPNLPALKFNGVQKASHPIVVNVYIAPRP